MVSMLPQDAKRLPAERKHKNKNNTIAPSPSTQVDPKQSSACFLPELCHDGFVFRPQLRGLLLQLFLLRQRIQQKRQKITYQVRYLRSLSERSA